MIVKKTMLGALAASAAWLLPSYALAADVPDISGPWQIVTPVHALETASGEAPPVLPNVKADWDKNKAMLAKKDASADPMARCLPPGVPRLMLQAFPFNIVQGRTMYGMMFEWNHLNRIVYMDQDRFEMLGPAYLGQSMGHWDGDTLVVETNNYNATTWLDDTGLPHSTELTTTERIRLKGGGKELEDRITFDDPKTFSKPWEAVLTFEKKPGRLIEEDYCLGRTGQAGPPEE